MLRQFTKIALAITLLLLISGCSVFQQTGTGTPSTMPSAIPDSSAESELAEASSSDSQSNTSSAEVLKVEVRGQPGAYTFVVTVSSPDTGCEQYVNWWEVLSEEGQLLYRRVLLHSHVDEQPFTRSGGPVDIQPNQVVIVRSHMHPQGYNSQAQQGTVASGFNPVILPEEFAAEVASQNPQPQGCNF